MLTHRKLQRNNLPRHWLMYTMNRFTINIIYEHISAFGTCVYIIKKSAWTTEQSKLGWGPFFFWCVTDSRLSMLTLAAQAGLSGLENKRRTQRWEGHMLGVCEESGMGGETEWI